MPSLDAQRQANTELWAHANLVGEYATRTLRPVEVVVLVRYRDDLAGPVLELGCGAGRLTGYLCEISNAVRGVDLSAAMIEYCRSTYPQAELVQQDLRDVWRHPPGSRSAVLAPFNVLDALDHQERREVLDAVRRILASDGLLVMSSHNRAYAPQVLGPARQAIALARSQQLRLFAQALLRLPRRWHNRRRHLLAQTTHPDYAVLNDDAHDYSTLHYYISRDAQAQQLRECGFELVECLDLAGYPVAAGEDAPGCPELHYVARRVR